MLRARRGGFIYRGDLYIRAWELQSESRQRTHQHQRNLCISVSSFGHTSIACTVAKFRGFSFAVSLAAIRYLHAMGLCLFIEVDNLKSYYQHDTMRDSDFPCATVSLASTLGH